MWLCYTWVDRCGCRCYKASFSSVASKELLLVEPLNHSSLLTTTRLKCKWKIQKAGDFSLAQESVWFNLVNAHPVFLSYIYMCICSLYTHICSRYTCTVCIVTYIWFYGSSSCSQEAIKKRQSSRLKKIQQQLGTYRQWPSRTVIRHNTDKEDIEGRNTN